MNEQLLPSIAQLPHFLIYIGILLSQPALYYVSMQLIILGRILHLRFKQQIVSSW